MIYATMAYPMMVQRYVALGYAQNVLPAAADLPIPTPYLTVEKTQQDTTLKIFEKQTALAQHRPAIGFNHDAESDRQNVGHIIITRH